MYAIIIGAGEVGSHLARILIEAGHEVAIVEVNEELANRLDVSLNALVVRGSGVNASVLLRAGVARADLLLALTSVDEVNLIACMAARKHGKQQLRVLARVRESQEVTGEIALSAEDLGLDALISPEQSITTAVIEDLRYSGSGEMRELANGKLVLVGMDLADDSPLVHETLGQLRDDFAGDFLVVGVQGVRGRIPKGSDKLDPGDRAYVLTRPEYLTELAILSGRPWYHVRNVLVVGCGATGLAVARGLHAEGFTLTIIERDYDRAQFAAAQLERALVLNGDGSDPDFLREQIDEREIDAVVVMLRDPEKSVLIGIFASSLGARKTIVRCDKSAYTTLATKQGVDGLISPKRAMTDAIQKYVRKGKVELTLQLGEQQGEVIQFQVPPRAAGTELVRKPLKDLDLPDGVLVGAVFRNGEVILGDGNLTLQPGDGILVVTRADVLRAAERIFS